MTRLQFPAPVARFEIAAGSDIYDDDLVALNADGKAVPAADTAGLVVIGYARRLPLSDDAPGVVVDTGYVAFANDTTAPLTRADIGSAALVKDAVTLAKTSTNKITAGIVVDVTVDGEVYVDLTPAALAAAKALNPTT